MCFRQKEREHRERSDTNREGTRSEEVRGGTVGSEWRKLLPGTASALQTFSATGTGRCGCCNKSHPSEKCYSVLKPTRVELELKVDALTCVSVASVKVIYQRFVSPNVKKCKGNCNVFFV